MDAALQICEHIRVKVSELKFENMPLLSMTVSFGLSEYSEQVDTVRLFTHSDHALYKAKEVRNAIRVFEREASLNGDR
ncbi:response regulator PleD [compost metagenome]